MNFLVKPHLYASFESVGAGRPALSVGIWIEVDVGLNPNASIVIITGLSGAGSHMP